LNRAAKRRPPAFHIVPPDERWIGSSHRDRSQTKNMNNTENLKQRLDGTVILPGDPAYDKAPSIWNSMIDRKSAIIVRCRTEADVAHAVKHARETSSLLPFVAAATTSPVMLCATADW
jgi:hypothetical protein